MSSIRHRIFASMSLGIFLGTSAAAVAQNAATDRVRHEQHASPPKDSPLVSRVRRATERFRDVSAALADGWVRATPCVSGPDVGAMGVHFTKPERIGDGVLRGDQPEALIYEPGPGGSMRLVGVEFLEIAEVWDSQQASPPVLEGHLLHLVTAPNRYALPAFYELHVWAWERNPHGSFADWNPRVSCDRQTTE